MKYILKFEDYLVKTEKVVVVTLVLAMVGFSILQMLLRILLHSGIVWLDPLLRHMVLWAGLSGAALAARYSRHFALEAFVKFAPKGLRRPLEVFASLFTVAASGLLCYAAYKFIRDEFTAGAIAFYINSFPVKDGWAVMIIPIAFALTGFHALLGIFRPQDTAEEQGLL